MSDIIRRNAKRTSARNNTMYNDAGEEESVMRLQYDKLRTAYTKLYNDYKTLSEKHEKTESALITLATKISDLQKEISLTIEERDRLRFEISKAQAELYRFGDIHLSANSTAFDETTGSRRNQEYYLFKYEIDSLPAYIQNMRDSLRENTHLYKSEIPKVINNAIQEMKNLSNSIVENLNEYLDNLYFHGFERFSIWIQYYFMNLMKLNNHFAVNADKSDDTMLSEEINNLGESLEMACKGLGIYFNWAQPGETVKRGITHDLLDESCFNESDKTIGYVVRKCVSPGIVLQLPRNKKRTIRLPVVTIEEAKVETD